MPFTLSAIRNLFVSVAYQGDHDTDCLLKEVSPTAKIRKISIHSGESRRDWFLLHPDAGRRCSHNSQTACCVNSPLLSVNGSAFHHKVCDAVLFLRDAGQLKLAYFDLKSTSTSGVAKQFKSMRYFMRYAISLSESDCSIAKECAFCFRCINSKINQREAFIQNLGATEQAKIPVFDVRVHDGQIFDLGQFVNFL